MGRWAARGMAISRKPGSSHVPIEGERDSPYIFRQEDFFNLFVHALEISSKDGGAPVVLLHFVIFPVSCIVVFFYQTTWVCEFVSIATRRRNCSRSSRNNCATLVSFFGNIIYPGVTPAAALIVVLTTTQHRQVSCLILSASFCTLLYKTKETDRNYRPFTPTRSKKPNQTNKQVDLLPNDFTWTTYSFWRGGKSSAHADTREENDCSQRLVVVCRPTIDWLDAFVGLLPRIVEPNDES